MLDHLIVALQKYIFTRSVSHREGSFSPVSSSGLKVWLFIGATLAGRRGDSKKDATRGTVKDEQVFMVRVFQSAYFCCSMQWQCSGNKKKKRKSNIDTKNDGFQNVYISFQIWLFWVSMLVFGGICLIACAFFWGGNKNMSAFVGTHQVGFRAISRSQKKSFGINVLAPTEGVDGHFRKVLSQKRKVSKTLHFQTPYEEVFGPPKHT